MFKILSSVIFLLFCVIAMHAQNTMLDPYVKFSNYSKNDGLTNNYVLDILQDSKGFLWVATMEGLNRFDGYSFMKFMHNEDESSSISNNIVTCLAEDHKGNLWVGTQKGLNLLNSIDFSFSLPPWIDNEPGLLTDSHIRALLPDGKVLWIETANGELIKLDLDIGGTSIYRHNPPSMVSTYYYHTIFMDDNRHLYIGGRYMDIYHFDPSSEVFTTIEPDPKMPGKKRDNDVAFFFIDSDKQFWVGGTDGLYSYDAGSEIFEKYLPVSSYSMAERIPGEIWIGTGNGLYILNKQDKAFTHLSRNENQLGSLAENHTTKLYKDRNGNIWIGTLNGLSVFQPSRNKFRHIFHVPGVHNTPASSHITAIAQDHQHQIWIGTKDKGLDCFDEKWHLLHHYGKDQNAPYSIASDKISTIMVDGDNDVWVGQWAGIGFNIINPAINKSEPFKLLINEQKADWYNDFLADRNGNNWVGIWGAQGLYGFNKNSGRFMAEGFLKPPFNTASRIRSLAYDGRYVWIALDKQNRMYCYDSKYEKYCFYSIDHYNPFDFNSIHTIVNDQSGICFFTDKGTYMKTGMDSFAFEKISIPQPLQNNNPGYMMIDELAQKLHSPVHGIIEDKVGSTWIASTSGLVMTRDKNNFEHFSRQDTSNRFLPSDTIWSMAFELPDILWLGTEKGLGKFNITEKRFYPVHADTGMYLSSHLVSFVFQASDGSLWIGTTDRGLNKLDPVTRRITHYPNDPGNPSAFWGDHATAIFEDENEFVWIGGIGLNKYDPAVDGFIHFTEADGLSDNNVKSILSDHRGHLWISTSNGLSNFDPILGLFQNYFEKDGLQDNDFTAAAYKLHNGKLLFGGRLGLNVVDPATLETNTLPPLIQITEFSLYEEPHDHLLRTDGTIKLSYDENYFSFTFTALDFSNPTANMYAYKLENFDTDWIKTSANQRIARYTNVFPGDYVFRVKASNNDGIWNDEGVSVHLSINPPFWKTNLFYSSVGFAIFLAIYLFIMLMKKKSRRKNQYLEMEQKLLRSQMNPHFIFNSLSSIQSFILDNNPVKAGSYLSRFADLIRSILYNSREAFVPVYKELKTLENYIELQQLRFDSRFDFNLEVDTEIDTEYFSIPPMMAQPFVENSIEHGMNELERQGHLNIRFTKKEDTLVITICDNGIGLAESGRKNRKKAIEHRSLATLITKERLSLFNRSYKVKKYKLEMNEMKGEGGINEGTEVIITIPFNLTQ
jgi:ligand-binding sensor domain-containing protein